jgi:multicomponent Na+:H+ antiporter subunit F
MIEELFYTMMGLLCASCALCLYRLVKGPSLADALMALNALSTVGIGIVVVLGFQLNELFIDAAIPLALIAFISTLVVCKYLEGGIRVGH